jgi:hypothetical protein
MVTVVPVHTVKHTEGSRDIAPLIINLGTRWRCVVSYSPRPPYLGRKTKLLPPFKCCGTIQFAA